MKGATGEGGAGEGRADRGLFMVRGASGGRDGGGGRRLEAGIEVSVARSTLVEETTANVRGGGGVEQRAEAAGWTKGVKRWVNLHCQSRYQCCLAPPGE